jgi:signal transduction histidine kinase
VNNLLDNAARHSPGGTVEVHAGPGGIRVRDHGEGIAPEDLERLFERFYAGAADAPDGGAVFVLALPGASERASVS